MDNWILELKEISFHPFLRSKNPWTVFYIKVFFEFCGLLIAILWQHTDLRYFGHLVHSVFIILVLFHISTSSNGTQMKYISRDCSLLENFDQLDCFMYETILLFDEVDLLFVTIVFIFLHYINKVISEKFWPESKIICNPQKTHNL